MLTRLPTPAPCGTSVRPRAARQTPALPAAAARVILAVAMLALVGCDRVRQALFPPLLPSATAEPDTLALAPGEMRSVAVKVCPPQRYTSDVGYIYEGLSTVFVAAAGLPRGVQARWDREQFGGAEFGGRFCATTRLHLDAAADADLGADRVIQLRAWSPSNNNEASVRTLTLQAVAPAPGAPPAPPAPQACAATDVRQWQPQGDGLLPSAPGAVLSDARLARAGGRLLAAWTERFDSAQPRLAVRAREWNGQAWVWSGAEPINATDEVEIEELLLLGGTAAAADPPQVWLVYAAASIPGFGIAHPMRLVARRLAADQRFEPAIEPISIGSPQSMRAIHSRHGLFVAVAQRERSQLALWHARPEGTGPSWRAIDLPAGLAGAQVRTVAMTVDSQGSPLLALNRVDAIDGRPVERVQVWRLAVGGDPDRLEPAAPDQVVQSTGPFLQSGAYDLVLMAGPAPDGPQAFVTAWTANELARGHRVTAFDGSGRSWAPLGNWDAHAAANNHDSDSFHRQILAGCAGAATLVWSDFGQYPNQNAWVARATSDSATGWLTLGGGPAQGDPTRWSGRRISIVWDGIDGDPLALVLRSDPTGGEHQLVLRSLRR
jgi:hypothetical protein